MDRNRHRSGNGSGDYERDRYGRGGDRRRDTSGGWYDVRDDEHEGYGRYAMGGRDYSTSGRYFDEDPRGRNYGGISRYSDEERRYNMGGYGGGRTQSDFYMSARDPEHSRMSSDFYSGSNATQREGEGGEYGFSPSDDYERGGYGREDQNYGRRDRDYGWDMNRGRGGQPWNRSEAGRERGMFDRGGRGHQRGDDSRFIDEEFATEYRRGQSSRGGSAPVWGDYGDWSSAGPHVGRGPKGYERSKDRMKEEICERLTRHGHIDASNIEIMVENDEVTLTGTVDSRAVKRLAEDIAESVFGVRDVHNQLRIQRTETEGTTSRTGEEQQTEQENSQTNTRGNRRTAPQS